MWLGRFQARRRAGSDLQIFYADVVTCGISPYCDQHARPPHELCTCGEADGHSQVSPANFAVEVVTQSAVRSTRFIILYTVSGVFGFVLGGEQYRQQKHKRSEPG